MVQYDVKRVTKGTESFMVSFDFAKTPITQVADYIIIAASKNKTSDIHFDPRDQGMMVRFRIDGDCQDYTFIPKAYERNLTTRIKLLASMNITETRLPQDGAIKGQFGDTYLDMRVACLPTSQGEKIVIRILDYTRSLQGIDSLGFHPKNLEKIKRMSQVPNGIILVTGATGSGKSTTTYSMLQSLNKPEVNVITVEDPVEMNIEGINQVMVNAEIGMTFAAALRSILREDPNVILIGEIRDSETAQIAVRAAITGHLVMSTLHTNNALATIERLLDMNVERYLLSTALTGIVSQRLAKQLCDDCKFQREPTPYEKKVFKAFLHEDIEQVWDANPKGCENCRKGYRGRIAVHEVLELDDKIRSAINDEDLKKEDLTKMVYSGSTISMLQDALIKAKEGQTSFEEVYKTIEIENEDEDNYAQELESISEKDENEEMNAKPNLPTGDDLLEDEMSGNTPPKTPLTAAVSIPGITTNPETEETSTEPQQTNGIPTINTTPVQPETTPAQTNGIPTINTAPAQPDTNGIPSVDTTPPQQVTVEQPTIPITIDNPVQPDTNGIPSVDTTPPQQVTVEQPTIPITIDNPAPPDTNGIPSVDTTPPQQVAVEQPTIPITIDNPAQPDTTPEQTNGIPSVDTTPPQQVAVEQPTIPITIGESIIPTVDIAQQTLPTEAETTPQSILPNIETTTEPLTAAMQTTIPAIPETQAIQDINPPAASIPELPQIPAVQAVSIIPGIPEETQEQMTGSEVLNDPGIRIANQPMQSPIVDTPVTPPPVTTAEPMVPLIPTIQ